MPREKSGSPTTAQPTCSSGMACRKTCCKILPSWTRSQPRQPNDPANPALAFSRAFSHTGGSPMSPLNYSSTAYTRREILKAGSLAAIPLVISPAILGAQGPQPLGGQQQPPGQQQMTANGGIDPYPIPWLD